MNSVASALIPKTDVAAHPDGPVRLQSSRILTGCNIYHARSVIRQRVDLGILAGASTALAGPEFAPAFLARFGSLRTFVPRSGLADDFIARLTSPQGAAFDDALLQAILAVEASLAFVMHRLDPVSFAAIERHPEHTDLIWACRMPWLSRGAAEVALSGVLALLPHRLYGHPKPSAEDFASALETLQVQARRRRLAPATSVIMLAADERRIPCEIVGRQHLRLGYGKAQHHFCSSTTSMTSIAAQKICFDKRLTNRSLSALRLPVPRQIKVDSAEAAHAAAARLGFPVVIKPLRGAKGRGVTAGLTDPAGIAAAFERAHRAGADVLVEDFVPGVDHRLLVVGGRFVAALLRRPPTVTGDGKTTVEALVDALNADPCRDGFRMFKVAKDAEMKRLLAKAGLSMTDVLAEGRTVALRSAANITAGGLPIDITDDVHPDNRELAEHAAGAVGLDVAGVDFVTTDITRSHRDIGGRIIEVNAKPGLDIHMWPYVGKPRNVAAEVLKLCFPPGNDGRIPVVAVAGDKGTGSTARSIDRILRGAGRSVALVLSERAFLNGVCAGLSEKQHATAARLLLRDPEVDVLVSTVSTRQAAARGTGLEAYRLSVIMDRIKDGKEELFYAGLDVVQRATTDCFVVDARNHGALERLRDLGPRQLILVGDRPDDPVLQRHLHAGGAGVTRGSQDADAEILLLSGTQMLASFLGPATNRRLRNGMLFAIAAAYGVGLSGPQIMAALRNAPAMVPED